MLHVLAPAHRGSNQATRMAMSRIRQLDMSLAILATEQSYTAMPDQEEIFWWESIRKRFNHAPPRSSS